MTEGEHKMNIIEKNISEYTEGQYNKYGDKIKEIQSSLDHDLKDYKSISDKIVRLDSLSKMCEIMINKSKEKKGNSLLSKLIKAIKCCLIVLYTYFVVSNIIPLVNTKVFDMNNTSSVIMELVVYVVLVAITSVIAKAMLGLVEHGYDSKITEISLKKIVIESNYRQLNKGENTEDINEEEVEKSAK